ncbi:MAG: rod shape-determining protein MreC, partial [Candidatus Moranbacteria bacterium]|nr:rod shape-determining protein MreC [Candidatus Moranbacteria bacterium]
PVGLFDSLRGPVGLLFLPFQKVFYSVSAVADGTGEFLGSIGQLKNDNKKLLSENQALLARSAMLQDVESENVILRSQLNLLPRDHWNLVAASVVSQDPQGMGNWLEIDRGSDDGIAVGMSVVVSNSILVGRVQQVNAKTAQVLLLTNSKSTINASTSDGGTKGIIRGEYGLGIIFDMILQTDSIKTGDDVVTSGVGGEIPKGLYVGTVQEVHDSDDHLFQQAVVTSPLQVSKLQVVFVIKDAK